MMNLFKRKRASSVLGLSLDGNRLEAVVVRRNNGSLQVQQALAVPLALSPLSGDPELVGREIRNHLDQAGIRERRCAVCLPLNWVLTVQTKLPDLPEEDVASFLQIEAERGFTAGYEHLYIQNSRARASAGEQYAIMMGIPRNHLATLEKALKAAQLKPVTFSLGIAALASGGKSPPPPALTLALAAHGIDLQVTAGGGIAALRSLDGAGDAEAAQKGIDADLVAREIRITLGQLPPVFANEAGTVKIFGRGETARQFVTDIARRTELMGLRVELMERASDAQFTLAPSAEIALSPALALAADYLRGIGAGPEFLPPKAQPWKQLLSAKYSAKKLAWVGAAAGAAAACVLGAFLFQQWEIWNLEAKWQKMEPTVKELTEAQDQIRKYRPWYDRTFPALRIMRAVAQSFPEQGTVTAKSLEIRDLTTVNCSGAANNNQSYLRLLATLHEQSQITELKTETVHGQAPEQFTFNFQWDEGGQANGN
jgi:hypothetical protein